MYVDVGLSRESNIGTAGRRAPEFESAGFDAMWTAETAHDPFLPLVAAADGTRELGLGTSIAVAFARNPMTLAHIAWDLQEYSEGRFHLGIGSQVAAHITRRFSMEWSRPAARMREFVLAIRAIWDTWVTGSRLDFDGDFYHHTLMTPFFSPEADTIARVGPPKIYLAGVGTRMTEVAGEVADGFICHGFTTERYLREVTIPALERGRARSARPVEDFQIVGPPFVVTGADDTEIAEAAAATRRQLAFYASTPAYRPVLELHGWGRLQPDLAALSKRGEWEEMGSLVSDEVLETFAVVAEPAKVAAGVMARYGDVIQRFRLSSNQIADAERRRILVGALRQEST
jgi:probable F420-dependent oxidoreductase